MSKEIAFYLQDEFGKRGVDDVIVNVQNGKATQIKFTNSKISTTQNWEKTSISIFAAIKKKLLTTTLKDASTTAADDAVEKLMKFSSTAMPNPEYDGIAKGPFKYNEIENCYDKKVEELGENSVDYVKLALDVAKVQGAQRAAGVFEVTTEEKFLVSSNKVEAEDKGTKLYFSLRAFADKNSSGHKVTNSRTLKDFDVVRPVEEAVEIAKMSMSSKAADAGNYDVLFMPLAMANILNQAGMAASAFNVDAGLSCYQGQINKPVASKAVTLEDNGSLPNGFNSIKFDEEGVPTQKNTIIENGVLKTYLHNTTTAKKFQTITTGNAGLIEPYPFNLVLKKSNINKDAMFSEIRNGLLITNTWYTRFENLSSGAFSTIPRDGMFLIHNGKIERPVRDLRVSENLITLLQNIKMVGSEEERIFGWEAEIPVICPPVLVNNVRLTRSTA